MKSKALTATSSTTQLTNVYQSPLGNIVLTSNGTALTGLRFEELLTAFPAQGNPLFADTCRWLDLYFNHHQPDFIPQLALSGTPFQLSVWRELLTIPYGHTVTYGAIAKRLHCRSAQAVGSAVGRNPIALIIPCHRVIGSNGHLTGYAYGLARKQWLLSHETPPDGKRPLLI